MRFALVLMLLATTVQPLWAHPRLVRSAPVADGRLSAAPVAVSLTFNEPVNAALSRVTLLDAQQRPVLLAPLAVDPKDPATVVARVTGALRPGRYTVQWQAAGDDGHPVRGTFAFTITASPDRPGDAAPGPRQ